MGTGRMGQNGDRPLKCAGSGGFCPERAFQTGETPAVLKKAVALATGKGYLRKNTIDAVTGLSYDNNCAEAVKTA